MFAETSLQELDARRQQSGTVTEQWRYCYQNMVWHVKELTRISELNKGKARFPPCQLPAFQFSCFRCFVAGNTIYETPVLIQAVVLSAGAELSLVVG